MTNTSERRLQLSYGHDIALAYLLVVSPACSLCSGWFRIKFWHCLELEFQCQVLGSLPG